MPHEHAALIGDDPDVYGVLAPREPGPGLLVKAVDRDTALLLLTLTEPGPLPHFMRAALGLRAAQKATQLVLDGVLEVEHRDEFVTAAAARVPLGLGDAEYGSGRLARISHDALRTAAAIETDSPAELASSLYGYNRQPFTPEWSRRLPDRETVAAFLGADHPQAGWVCHSANGAPWTAWSARDHRGSRGDRTYKLYVSPLPEELPAAFAAAADGFRAASALAFKVGNDAYGVLRPDKLVGYFHSFDDLAGAAARIEERLAGCPAQGVPFTAETCAGGLLSWGADPPARESMGADAESWRFWVATRLATGLLAGRAAGMSEPWRFALERVQAEGVDPATWSPTQSIWMEEAR